MGHRANYAIRQDGDVELYYAHWGGLSAPQDVFWGPAAAQAFIRENERVGNDDWLDDVWGEGGVALDKDTQTIALFAVSELTYAPLGPVFAELMGALWNQWGWQVRLVDGMPDIAEQVGFDRAIAEAEPLPMLTHDVDKLVESWREDGYISGLLSVRVDEGWDDRMLPLAAATVLGDSTDLVERFEELPDVDEALAHHRSRELESWEDERPLFGDELISGVVLEPTSKRVCLWSSSLSERDLATIERVWQGWTLERYEGVDEHFELTGRPRPEAMATSPPPDEDAALAEALEEQALDEDEALGKIASLLFEEDRDDPSQIVRKLMDEHKGKDTWANPHALRSPVDARPDADARRRVFESALVALVEARRQA